MDKISELIEYFTQNNEVEVKTLIDLCSRIINSKNLPQSSVAKQNDKENEKENLIFECFSDEVS